MYHVRGFGSLYSQTLSVDLGNNLCWNSTGIAAAGTASNTISDPRCVYITSDDTVYLCGHTIGYVLRSRSNETTTSAATTNYGDHIDYLSFDTNGFMYANAHNDDLVRKYAPNTVSGTIVAGAGSSVTGTLDYPTGTAVDDNFNLYIADQKNDRIAKLASGATSLVTAINTGNTISKHSALLLPNGTANQIYISDENGKEVYLWTFNAVSPSVTYTNVIDGTTLKKPRGIKLDSYGNLYVADQDNDRVVVFCAGSTTGLVVMQAPDKVKDIAFDSNMNLYILADDGILYKHALL